MWHIYSLLFSSTNSFIPAENTLTNEVSPNSRIEAQKREIDDAKDSLHLQTSSVLGSFPSQPYHLASVVVHRGSTLEHGRLFILYICLCDTVYVGVGLLSIRKGYN